MNVFDLFATLSLDTSEYEKGLNTAEQDASSFGSKLGSSLGTAAKVGSAAIMAIGTATVTAGSALIKNAGEVAEYGDQIDKMSQKVGMSAEAYQEWDYVMQISGTEMLNMTTGLKTLTNKFDDAVNGSSSAIETFERLGLSMEDIQGLSREDLFATVITQFQGMEESAERAALANDLFGRSGQELAPLFNTTAQETQRLIEEVNNLGGVMSNDAVKASAAYQDQLTALTTSFDGLKRNLTDNFLPSITTVMGGLTDIFSGNYDIGIDQISEGIDELVSNLTEALPAALEVGVNILEALATSILENLPTLIPVVVDLLLNLAQFIIENLPLLIDVALQIILALADGLIEALPERIPAIVQVVMEIVTKLTEPETLAKLIEAAIQLIIALQLGMIQAIPELIKALPEIISNIVRFFIEQGPTLIESGFELILSLISGMLSADAEMFDAVVEIIDNLGESFGEMIDKAIEWGKDLMSGFIDGIKEKWGDLKDTMKNTAQTVKDFLGFSEPDKGPLSNFHTYAPDMMDLFIKGIQDNENRLQDQLNSTLSIDPTFGEIPTSDIISVSPVSGVAPATGNIRNTSGGNTNQQHTVILELDKVQLGKVIYTLNNQETQRMGVNLAGGLA